MSSVNTFFTIQYAQPPDYHFSHDSVFLARRVFEITLAKRLIPSSVLDLCAGCGVVGLDFLFHLSKEKLELPKTIDFLEVQNIYNSYFQENVATLRCPAPKNFLNYNYADIIGAPDFFEKYDLILCNPPYFRVEQGLLSPSNFKNRCRFFIDSDLKNLISCISHCLANTGSAYVLIKSMHDHGIDLDEELTLILQHLPMQFKKIGLIRSTDLYEFNKI